MIGCLPLIGGVLAQSSKSEKAQSEHTPKTITDQFSTAERLQKPGWWPTKGDAPSNAFAGATSCVSCHSEIASNQKMTQMAQTARPAKDSPMLLGNPKISLTLGRFSYQIARTGQDDAFSVTDGQKTITEPLLWAFGTGTNGQSYLLQYQGSFYEARLSYYGGSKSFDITPNHTITTEGALESAIGRRISEDEAPKCFGCHTTGAVTDEKFDPTHAHPGITCEVCHGPGAAHVAASKAGLGEAAADLLLNPGRLSPTDSVDFCGACHRTWWDVTLAGFSGVHTLRFPAYRLEKSQCWGNGDSRITCIACHDPHKPLVRQTAAYDSHCLSCHRASSSEAATNDHPGKACPVRTRDCASCHMPKYEVPEMHSKFTDHLIRVAREGEALPQ